MKTRNFKIAAILIAAVMACSLTACTESVEKNENNSSNENTVNAPINTEVGDTQGVSDTPEESKAPEESTASEESKLPEAAETTVGENGGTASEDKGQPDGADNSGNTDSKQDVQFSGDPVPLTSETGKGEAVAKLAADQVGVMYQFACASPDKGFDNSGLMYYALTENGITCPRFTRDIAQLGSKIKYDQLQAGDLAFFEYDDDGSVIIYGGVYLGDGEMAVSMSEGIPVKVVDITTQYYRSNFAWGVCVAR